MQTVITRNNTLFALQIAKASEIPIIQLINNGRKEAKSFPPYKYLFEHYSSYGVDKKLVLKMYKLDKDLNFLSQLP